MSLSQRQQLQQVVRVDPKLVLASTLLQMNHLELEQAVEQELTENPALERLEDEPDAAVPYGDLIPERSSVAVSYDDVDSSAARVCNPDEEADWTNFVIAPVSLRDHLRDQLQLSLSPHLHAIGQYLIDAVNDHGYLEMEVEAVALSLNASLEDVEVALDALQACEPAGVGARTLQECLILQVCASGFMHDALAVRMLSEAWQPFTKREWKRIARLLKTPLQTIELCAKFVLQLAPHPGDTYRPSWESASQQSGFGITPDVVIRRSEAGFEVELRGLDPSSLALNSRYRQHYLQIRNGAPRGIDASEQTHVRQYTERAVNFINSLKQRRRTMRKIVQYLLESQTGFVTTGSYAFLCPLTRLQLSKEVGLHESSVSRATANKFVQLPNQEVVPFEVFFRPSLRVRKAIEQLLAAEDPNKPLSDEQIAAILREQGIKVARRTINKYRAQGKVLSSRRR